MIEARGVQNPSDEEVKHFREKVWHHRPYGSIIGLINVVRSDARTNYAGTRAYLSFQGLDEPSVEDLVYFHRRIKRALFLRIAVSVTLVVAGWLYLWWIRALPFR